MNHAQYVLPDAQAATKNVLSRDIFICDVQFTNDDERNPTVIDMQDSDIRGSLRSTSILARQASTKQRENKQKAKKNLECSG